MNIIFITFFVVVSGTCCNGRYGKSVYGWSKWALPATQQVGPICWIYSTINYVQMYYNFLFGIKYQLSPSQINDNIADYCSGTYSCNGSVGNKGGWETSALDYISGQGIMTEFMYSLIQKYDRRYITPIKISNIRNICYEKSNNNYECIRAQLKRSPVLTSIAANALKYFESNFSTEIDPNHVVVITDFCEYQQDTYIEYQNSWGTSWGDCNGMGYLRITFGNSTIRNNRNILSYPTVADISDWRGDMKFHDNINLKYLLVVAYIIISLGICMMISGLLFIIIMLKKRRIFVQYCLPVQQGDQSSTNST